MVVLAWLAFVVGESGVVTTCAVHQAASAHASASGSEGHAGMTGAATGTQGDEVDPQECTCLDACEMRVPAAEPTPAQLPASVVGPVREVAVATTRIAPPDRGPRLLPFAIGPPIAARS